MFSYHAIIIPNRWPIPPCPLPHSVQIRCRPLHSQLSPVAAPWGLMAPKSNRCHRKDIWSNPNSYMKTGSNLQSLLILVRGCPSVAWSPHWGYLVLECIYSRIYISKVPEEIRRSSIYVVSTPCIQWFCICFQCHFHYIWPYIHEMSRWSSAPFVPSGSALKAVVVGGWRRVANNKCLWSRSVVDVPRVFWDGFL